MVFTTSRFLIAVAVGIIIVLSQLYLSLSNIRDTNSIISDELYLLSKDINIIPVHSHNDEWRSTPFLDAYKIGAKSIELDVWAFENSENRLYIGHNRNYLSKSLNLQKYYLDPIYNILSTANNLESTRKNGVFYDDPGQTVFLYIDIKLSTGITTLEYLTNALSIFLEKDWITFFNDSSKKIEWRPLTVIITGNYPLEYITKMENRYYFVDSPILDIFNDDFINLYKPGEISLTCSGSLKKLANPLSMQNGLTDSHIKNLQKIITKSHELNLITRLWDTPNWPVRTRNKVWLQLLELQVDLLNVDDLKSVVKFF